jgi:hypothetical protein
MTFLDAYFFAQAFHAEPPSQWPTDRIIKFEKRLRLESQLASTSESVNAQAQFLEVLKTQRPILAFLDAHPEFAHHFRQNTNLLQTYPDPDYERFGWSSLAADVEAFLSPDWEAFVAEEFEVERFYYLKFTWRYTDIMPVGVRRLIIHKLESKLESYRLATTSSKFDVEERLFVYYAELAEKIGEKKLIQLVQHIRRQQHEQLRDILESVNKPGIVNFFEILFGGFYYLFYHPTDPQEQRKRKRVMGDFKFTLIILGVIGVLIVGAAYYGEQQRAAIRNKQELEKLGFYPSLYYYDKNGVQLGPPYPDTLQTGYDFFQNRIISQGESGLTFINTSPFEVLLFSDANVINSFFKTEEKRQAARHCVWIRPGDTLRWDTHGIPFHLYVGRKLSPTSLGKEIVMPRFQHPNVQVQHYTPYPIEIHGGFMEFLGKNYNMILRADRTFYVNGQQKFRDTVFKLF